MADLRSQLRAYVEATIERVDAEDALATPATAPKPTRGRGGWRRPAVVALGSALATLVVIGGLTLLFRQFGEEPEVTTTFAGTTTTIVTTTQAPTTTAPTTTAPTTTTTTIPAFPAALRMTWARVPHQAAFEKGWIAAAAVGGPGIVAVGGSTAGADAAVWISADASTWERIESNTLAGEPDQFGNDGDQFMTDVVSGPQGLVAVGGDNQVGAVVWTSPDGRTWTRVPHDEAVFGGENYGFMHAVTVGGPGLVAVGESDERAAVWTSADGITWTRAFTGEHYEFIEDVVAWNGRLYAVGFSGWLTCCPRTLVEEFRPQIWVSDDGQAWDNLQKAEAPGEPGIDVGPSPDAQWSLSGITADSAGLLAIGFSVENGAPAYPVLWRSTDGETWVRTVAGFLEDSSIYYLPTALLVDGDRLLAGHGEASIWGSADSGLLWHRIAAFELSTGALSGGELDPTGAPPYYSYLNDLISFGTRVYAFGKDGIWSGTEDIGGGTCSWDPGDGSAGQCRTDAAVWVGTWDQG